MTTNSTIALNVKRYRKAAGLNQKQLAESAGISLACVKKIEAGKSFPETFTLLGISQAVGHSIAEIMREPNHLESIRFRAEKGKLSSLQRSIIVDDVSNWLYDYDFIERELGKRSSFRDTYSASVKSDPEKLAYAFRKRHGLDECSPIFNPCSLMETLGIKLLLYSANRAFSGLSVNDKKCGQAVIINNHPDISTEHKIFSAFHEIGHLIMHLSGYDVALDNEADEEENQAEIFASYCLMPRAGFDRYWESTRGGGFLDRVFATKRYFQVSCRTILKRLIAEKMAGEDVLQMFADEYKKRTGKTFKNSEEPFGLEPEALNRYGFWEDRLARLTVDAYNQGKISASKGASVLDIPISEFSDRARLVENLSVHA